MKGRIFRDQRLPFDPTWIVGLIKEQHPDAPEIAAAMARCSVARNSEPGYTRFVNDKRANRPGAEWQFDGNVVVRDPARGLVVLDVLRDGRIGGVEIVNEIPVPAEFLGADVSVG